MFTKEIEEALVEDRIDLAVQSLKDLPTELSQEFVIAAIPPRADPRDAFVSVQVENFSALPQGAKVGTSSLRRQAQLRALRADLNVCELRGNVDTRLRKLQQGQYDAIVLAAAGLDRLGLTESVKQLFSPHQMCPAAGQGALAIECRTQDTLTRDIVAALDHAPSRFAVTAERSALATLGGGCHLPVGVYCTPMGQGWTLTGVVARPDGAQVVRETMELHADHQGSISPEIAGHTLRQPPVAARRRQVSCRHRICASGRISTRMKPLAGRRILITRARHQATIAGHRPGRTRRRRPRHPGH